MKKRISQLLMAVAMLATGFSSLGCLFLLVDEPAARGILKD